MMEQIIFDEVCKFYNLTPEQLKQKRRFSYIVQARQICVFLLKANTQLSYSYIALQLGYSTHSNAHVGRANLLCRLRNDKLLQNDIAQIKKNIQIRKNNDGKIIVDIKQAIINIFEEYKKSNITLFNLEDNILKLFDYQNT